MTSRLLFKHISTIPRTGRLGLLGLTALLLAACSSSTTMAPVVDGNAVVTSPAPATPLAVPNSPTPATTGKQVAVLLPTSGNLANVSSAIRAGFTDAYQQNTNPDKPTIEIDNTNGQAITTAYAKAVHSGASAVVGPLEKADVQALADQGVDTFTLALNQIPTLSPTTNFYQFALAPQDEAYTLADKAWYQGYSQPVIIAPDTSWGQAAVTAFTEQWQRDGGKNSTQITYQIPGDPSSIVKTSLGAGSPNSQADVVILIANPAQAYQIVPIIRTKTPNVPVYATSIIYNGTANATANQALNGVSFVDIPALVGGNNPALANANASLQRWQQAHPGGLVRLYAFGYDAYQLSTMQAALSRPGFSYRGLTGTLYVDNQQQLHRKLAWGTFSNGLVIPTA